jgi:hypothetical protein
MGLLTEAMTRDTARRKCSVKIKHLTVQKDGITHRGDDLNPCLSFFLPCPIDIYSHDP